MTTVRLEKTVEERTFDAQNVVLVTEGYRHPAEVQKLADYIKTRFNSCRECLPLKYYGNNVKNVRIVKVDDTRISDVVDADALVIHAFGRTVSEKMYKFVERYIERTGSLVYYLQDPNIGISDYVVSRTNTGGITCNKSAWFTIINGRVKVVKKAEPAFWAMLPATD